MTKYRDILRLSCIGLTLRSIASSCQYSRNNSISEVLNRASERELTLSLSKDVADADLQYLLFPEKEQVSSRKSRMWNTSIENWRKAASRFVCFGASIARVKSRNSPKVYAILQLLSQILPHNYAAQNYSQNSLDSNLSRL